MICMELRVPIQAIQCIALLRGLPKKHPIRPVIEKDLKSWLKGYYGEKNCVHYLSLLPEEKYYIFHGLRLNEKKQFQMDIFLLSQNFGLIIEVKNISGTLRFKKYSKQVIRVFEGTEEGIPNPIQQVKRHQLQFSNWLVKKQLKTLPIEHLVMISKTSTIIETTDDNVGIFEHLIFAESLLDKIKELENKYPTPCLNKKKMTFLAETLLEEHISTIPNILKTYHLSPNELYSGVQCPKCKKFSMTYISGTWLCPHCQFPSKTAHFLTVDDYFLLINPTLTRKQFQELVQMDSTNKAKNLLISLKLPSTGTKRGTKYFLPPERVFILPEENLFI